MSTLRGSYGEGKRPGSDQGAPSGPLFFHCTGSHKSALARCPCAFRPRMLAQNGCPVFAPRNPGSLSARRGANFDIARATLLALCARQIAQRNAARLLISLPRATFSVLLCVSDRSRCGAVLILADSLRPGWKNIMSSLAGSFCDDLARVSWRRLRGP